MSIYSITKAPTFQPNAVATKSGWTHPTTGEILVALRDLLNRQNALHPHAITSVALNKNTFTSSDNGMVLTVTFSREVAWTGFPYIYMSHGNIIYEFDVSTSSPATILTFTTDFPDGDTFAPGALQWGHPATRPYANVDLARFEAVVAGESMNDQISVEMGVRTHLGGAQPNLIGISALPNQTLSVTVTGKDIVINGATDSSGNPTSTGNQVLAAFNANAQAVALASMTLQVEDPTAVLPLFTDFSGAVDNFDSTPTTLSGGLNADAGGTIIPFPGDPQLVFTFTNDNSSASLSFTKPSLAGVSKTS